VTCPARKPISPLSEVQAAVKRLNTAQFIRNTEEGWKLQTAQEKNWETERRGHLEPKPRDRNELARNALQQIFDEPEFKTFRYQNRSFRIGISVDGSGIGDEGELPLAHGKPTEGSRERSLLAPLPNSRNR
jgi:hypothetical protein